MDMENVIEIEVDAEQAKQGLSAYEVYLENGGTLSEVDWLASLKGEPGKDGKDGEQGPQGVPGSIKIIPVTELPTENIDTTAVYLIPSEEPDDENQYKEVVYINGKWEPFGNGRAKVDLTGYATEEYVDNSVVDIEGGYPNIKLTGQGSANSIKTDDYQMFTDMLNEMFQQGFTTPFFMTGGIDVYIGLYCPENQLYDGMSMITFALLPTHRSSGYRVNASLWIYLSWTDGVVTVTKITTNHGTVVDLKRAVVTGGSAQTITGKKIFNVLPESSAVPTEDVDLVNKKYVDDLVANAGSDAPIYYCSINKTLSDRSTNVTSSNGQEMLDLMSELFTKIYNQELTAFKVIVRSVNADSMAAHLWVCDYTVYSSSASEQKTTYQINCIAHGAGNVYTLPIHAKGTWTDNVFTCTQVSANPFYEYVRTDNVLMKSNTTSFTPTGDYHPATKKYVDDSVANLVSGDVPTYVIHKANSTPWYPNGDFPTNSYNTSNGPEVQAIIQEVYDAGYDAFNIVMFDSSYAYFFQHSLGLVQNKPTSITLEAHHMGSNGVEMPVITDMNIALQWNDNIAAVSSVRVQSKKLVSRLDTQYLNKTNTTTFTPTGDYHPATKKYVDDAIAASITTSLEASY